MKNLEVLDKLVMDMKYGLPIEYRNNFTLVSRIRISMTMLRIRRNTIDHL